jgi:hypothetical protein
MAYSLATGDNSFLHAFQWFVLGIELFSVLFRAILLNFSPVSWVMLGVGLLGMAVTYVVGKILHVQVNRPPSVAAKHLREEAGRQVFDDGRKHLGKLSIAQNRLVAGGDPQPIDQVRDVKAAEREEELRKSMERRRAALEEQAANDEFYRKMIIPSAVPSTNGHSQSRSFN